MAIPRARSVLSYRDFRLYLTGQVVSNVGSRMAPVALAFAVLDAGLGARGLGIVLAAGVVPQLVFVLVGGVLADRIRRRNLMLLADAVRAVVQTTSGLVIVTGHLSLPVLVGLQVSYGVATAFYAPASTGLVREVVAETAHLQQANSMLGLARSSAGITGPALAGVLVVTVGPGFAVLADGSSFLVNVICLALVATGLGETAVRAGAWGEFTAGWREFRSRTWVWVLTLDGMAYHATVVPAYAVLGPLVSRQELGGARAWASILTAQSAGALLAGLTLLRLRPRRPLLVGRAALLLDVLLLGALAATPPLWVLLGCAVIAGAALTVFSTLWRTTLQARVPPQALSRVTSYDWLGGLAMSPVGMTAIGLFAAFTAPSTLLVAVLVIHVVVTAVVLSVRSIQQMSTDTPADRSISPATP
jgi:Transmembrane secretion effector